MYVDLSKRDIQNIVAKRNKTDITRLQNIIFLGYYTPYN